MDDPTTVGDVEANKEEKHLESYNEETAKKVNWSVLKECIVTEEMKARQKEKKAEDESQTKPKKKRKSTTNHYVGKISRRTSKETIYWKGVESEIDLEKFRNEYKGIYTLNLSRSTAERLLYTIVNQENFPGSECTPPGVLIFKLGILYIRGQKNETEAYVAYKEMLPYLKSCVEDENKENLPPDDTKPKNVPGTPSLKSARKESVEDENKENIQPDDTKIPEREIKITSC